jgi:hypothetical protein
MSTSPEPDFDLEKLFLPAWAKEPSQANRYAKYEGEPERRGDRDRGRRDRPFRRGDAAPGRAPSRPASLERGSGPRPPRPSGSGKDRDHGKNRRTEGDRVQPTQPLPEVHAAFTPEDHAVELLAKQIRITGRAYPLFEIAQIILAKPDRHCVTLSVKKRPDGSVIQPLYVCALDDTLWLSEEDAVRYVLERHFGTFYQPERTPVEPPKGVYTFVAQCGMSGTILGPPNYHDYQNQLRKLHAERFPRMPFDAFKARVKIVKDEGTVKKWIEEQSWKTEYVCLNLPEPLKLPGREEVESHFRQVHLANIIGPVETYRLSGTTSRNLRDRDLLRLLRVLWENQKRFPLQLATVLSQQFAARGLQFFKVNKTVTHVAVARPHHLDMESTPVSEGVKRIVDFINGKPKCTHKQLLETLAARPPVAAANAGGAPAAEGAVAASALPTPTDKPTQEMTAVMTDLHWLIHQGHVIEFANGVLETAKKPAPRPAKPAAPETPPAPTSESASAAESVPAAGVEVSSVTISHTDDGAGAGPPVAEGTAEASSAPTPEDPPTRDESPGS